MPARIPRACRKKGCSSTTIDPSGYCESHRGEGWSNYKPGMTRQQRGYGRTWDIIRPQILKRDSYLCQECLRQGRATEAKCVDHIKPKAHGGTDEDSNLESLCWPCHKAKTARERLKRE
ncbi:HNH endonuclease [Sodalis sp. RH24]|uniref:HNH endonuclease n=1 Tax=unclassified Sodalis (in: enterobacteria) TaxID=2636512 RepID=UPI0039B4FB99